MIVTSRAITERHSPIGIFREAFPERPLPKADSRKPITERQKPCGFEINTHHYQRNGDSRISKSFSTQ